MLGRVTRVLVVGVLVSPVVRRGLINICVGVVGRGEKGGGALSLHSFGKAFSKFPNIPLFSQFFEFYGFEHACWTARSNRNLLNLMSLFSWYTLKRWACLSLDYCVTNTVRTGMHEPTLNTFFTSLRQADCCVWRPKRKPEAWDSSFWFLGAFPSSVSPSVAVGQQCLCKTCCHVLLSCMFNSVLGPWNAFCQSLWTCHVQTQPAERVYSLLCFCTFSKTAIHRACSYLTPANKSSQANLKWSFRTSFLTALLAFLYYPGD